MKTKLPWYKEETYIRAMIALHIISISFTLAISLVDGRFNPTGLLFILFAWLVLTPMSYLLRNNK